MLLPDHEILTAVESGRVGIDPWDPSLVQPASLDVRLGEEFRARICDPATLEITNGASKVLVRRSEDRVHRGPIDLLPGQFVLAHTLETITLPADIAARVEGKSSLARLGLLTHATAGFADPGFSGQITLELFNLSQENIPLVPGQPIGQLCFIPLTSPAKRPYGSPGVGHYQGQTGARASRFTAPAALEGTS